MLAKSASPLGFEPAARPSAGSSDAAWSLGAGESGVGTGGTLRTYSAIALKSVAVSFWKLRWTACAMGPNAVPRSSEWPVLRYPSRSCRLQPPIPESASLVRLYARQPSDRPPANLWRLSSDLSGVRGVWQSPQ